MRCAATAILAMTLLAAPALAGDQPVSDAEANQIQNALNAFGCAGGTMTKDADDDEPFEVKRAECEPGFYDFELDAQFNVVEISRD